MGALRSASVRSTVDMDGDLTVDCMIGQGLNLPPQFPMAPARARALVPAGCRAVRDG